MKVVETYPEHPISKVNVKNKTLTELKNYRLNEERSDIKKKKDLNDSKVAHM